MSKTAAGLVAYAKAQVGRPYWFGTFGQIANEALYKAKKAQYPRYYTASDFTKQYGQRVHDCAGLIKGYIMSDDMDAKPVYVAAYDQNADTMFNLAREKGPIGTIPEIPGLCVRYGGHVGVYIGNGMVIEARGHAYGVVATALKSRPWTHWYKNMRIDYGGVEANKPVLAWAVARPLKYMTSGDDVWELKRRLFEGGYYDARIVSIKSKSFGTDTVKAVKNLQAQKGLVVDGIAGKEVIAALGGTFTG